MIRDVGEVLAVSSVYETEPYGFQHQGMFLNLVILMVFSGEPLQLLDSIGRIERVMGRQRPFPNAPRIVDIDILFFGDIRIELPRLTIPHRGFRTRKFMYIPAIEVASLGFRPLWKEAFAPRDGQIYLYKMRSPGGRLEKL